MPSWSQIVMMAPWLDSRFVWASTAQACGIACLTARIAGKTPRRAPGLAATGDALGTPNLSDSSYPAGGH